MQSLNFAVSVENLDDGTICPACPKNQGTILESMDALFIGRKASSGQSVREPLFGTLLFGKEEAVDKFVEEYPTRSASRDTQDCNEFLAGNALRSRSRYAALSETAVFGRACRHEFPKKFISMKHGERLSYPVWILNNLLEEISDKTSGLSVNILYDVACVLESHLRAQGHQQIMEQITFAIPIFHCYGHKTQCQIRYSPRRLSGFGLTDGEVLERLWSFLRRFGRMTKEMRPNHRIDVLSDALLFYARKKADNLGILLCERMKKANTLLSEVDKDLTTLLDALSEPTSRDDVRQWAEQEAEWTGVLYTPQEPPLWTHGYIIYLKMYYETRRKWEAESDAAKLEVLFSHMSKLDRLLLQQEDQHNIIRRWTPEDPSFLVARDEANDRKKRQSFQTLHSKVVERWFLLSLKCKYAEGHELAKRLSKQITKATVALKKALDEYNNLVSSPNWSPPVKLAYDSISNPDSEIWRSSATSVISDVSTVPVSVRRKAVDLVYLGERCKEEITLLQGEMRNTFDHYCQQHEVVYTELCNINQIPLPDCAERRGKELYLRKKLLHIEWQVVNLLERFEDHIDDLCSPDMLHFEDIMSRESANTAVGEQVDIEADSSLLLSLPDPHSEEADTDIDSDCDIDEDFADSAFFSLDT